MRSLSPLTLIFACKTTSNKQRQASSFIKHFVTNTNRAHTFRNALGRRTHTKKFFTDPILIFLIVLYLKSTTKSCSLVVCRVVRRALAGAVDCARTRVARASSHSPAQLARQQTRRFESNNVAVLCLLAARCLVQKRRRGPMMRARCAISAHVLHTNVARVLVVGGLYYDICTRLHR